MLATEKILGIINWCSIFTSLIIFLTIFIFVYRCRQELRDISFLLTCNTCFSALLTCFTICIMTSSNLFNGYLVYNMKFCIIWGLFYDIFECSIYHSYCLQAFYRLCRVVFYRKKSLLSYSLYIILIIIQWLIVLTFLLPPVFIDWYSRLPTEKYCLIPYTYVIAETYHILILYLIPLIAIGTTYVWITTYMRRATRSSTLVLAAIQRKRNHRDLAVLKRIIMLISVLIVLRFPTVIFMIHEAIVGYTYPLTYGIVGVITSICLIFIGISTIYITSQLRKKILDPIFKRNNQVRAQRAPINHISTSVTVTDNMRNIQTRKQVILPRTDNIY